MFDGRCEEHGVKNCSDCWHELPRLESRSAVPRSELLETRLHIPTIGTAASFEDAEKQIVEIEAERI